MKNNKGITLIALVVTIIVLLILAGISIAMLTGENGILKNANDAKTQNAYYGADEQMKLAYMAVRTEIAAKTVANSSYDATANGNPAALLEVVKKDLNDDNWYAEVKTVTSGEDTITKIIMTYKDSAINTALSDGTALSLQKGSVNGEITLTKQSASYEFNTATASTTATNQ